MSFACGDETHVSSLWLESRARYVSSLENVVTLEAVCCQIGDLQALLSEGSLAEQRQFIKSFIRQVEVAEGQAILRYTVPLIAPGTQGNREVAVLPIVPSGGAGGTRTPYLRLAKAALSQMSYSPTILPRPECRSGKDSHTQPSRRAIRWPPMGSTSVQIAPGRENRKGPVLSQDDRPYKPLTAG